MRKKLLAIAAFLLMGAVLSISAQETHLSTVHIASLRIESRDEVTPGRMRSLAGAELVYTVYTANGGNLVYQLESADTRKPEVGKDYDVKQANDKEIVLMLPGKKHPAQVTFYIKSVSEKQVK